MGMFTQPLKAGTVLCYSTYKLDTPAISARGIAYQKTSSSLQITIRLLENVFNNSLWESIFKQYLLPFKAHS